METDTPASHRGLRLSESFVKDLQPAFNFGMPSMQAVGPGSQQNGRPDVQAPNHAPANNESTVQAGTDATLQKALTAPVPPITDIAEELRYQTVTLDHMIWRNEQARQSQTQGLEAAYSRADAARDLEMNTLHSLFVKRLELLSKKEEQATAGKGH
jgi:hypothetical protein